MIKAHIQNLIRRRSDLERAVWVTDDWSLGYFHWLGDVVPKLIIARTEIDEYGLLLPTEFQRLELVKETLEILDIKKFDFVPMDKAVNVGTLYKPIHTPISGDFNEAIMREVRQRFRSVAVPGPPPIPRIYISRRRAGKRRIVNEKEVLQVLDKFGFVSVEAEGLSFRQQISTFSGCEYLVSIHGAGLMNMLFMPANARVLELRKRDPAVPNCYFNLASSLELQYYYEFCPALSESEAPHSASLIVDLAELTKVLETFLDPNAEVPLSQMATRE